MLTVLRHAWISGGRGGGLSAVGVFVRLAAEELIESTMCVRSVPSESYERCTRPEGPGIAILTNHMRESET